MAVATYTYDTLPADERAALPSDTDVMSALATPVSLANWFRGRAICVQYRLVRFASRGRTGSSGDQIELTHRR